MSNRVSDVENSSVPVEDLRTAGFGDEVEKVATTVAGSLDYGAGGNVAVVSDPYVFVADEAPTTERHHHVCPPGRQKSRSRPH